MPGQGVLVGLAKSLEKLSSGFRINRAADDAAGLAISEGLRTQVRGNKQAVRNAQDGISLVQTAEGALNEVHSVLQRMRELAVQGSNDSNSADARNNINTELKQLRDELERIGNVTNFNGTKLLDGSASGSRALNFQVGANGTDNDRITVDLFDADVTAVSKFNQKQEISLVKTAETTALAKESQYKLNIEGKTILIDLSKVTAADPTEDEIKAALQKGIKEVDFDGYIKGGTPEATSKDLKVIDTAIDSSGTYTLTIDNKKYTYIAAKANPGDKPADLSAIADGLNEQLKNSGYKLELEVTTGAASTKKLKLTAGDTVKDKQVDFKLETTAAGAGIQAAVKGFKGQIGINHGTGFEFEVTSAKTIKFRRADGKNIDLDLSHSFSSLAKGKAWGTDDTHQDLVVYGRDDAKITDPTLRTTVDQVGSLTVNSHDEAQNLIRVLDQKIQSVSTARSNLGAVQNRFEHTITNLNVAVENLAASESRIRDTDMAQEMMQFTRNQILSQAGTSMLAQANQVPQGVLSLLR